MFSTQFPQSVMCRVMTAERKLTDLSNCSKYSNYISGLGNQFLRNDGKFLPKSILFNQISYLPRSFPVINLFPLYLFMSTLHCN